VKEGSLVFDGDTRAEKAKTGFPAEEVGRLHKRRSETGKGGQRGGQKVPRPVPRGRMANVLNNAFQRNGALNLAEGKSSKPQRRTTRKKSWGLTEDGGSGAGAFWSRQHRRWVAKSECHYGQKEGVLLKQGELHLIGCIKLSSAGRKSYTLAGDHIEKSKKQSGLPILPKVGYTLRR